MDTNKSKVIYYILMGSTLKEPIQNQSVLPEPSKNRSSSPGNSLFLTGHYCNCYDDLRRKITLN